MFSKDKLIHELNKKGWSRYRLSKESGVAQTTLRDIFGEKEVTPSTKTLGRIASSLGVPISSFFQDEREFLNDNIEVQTDCSQPNKLNTSLYDNVEKMDIEKTLSQVLDLLKNSKDTLMFNGKPLDNLTRDVLKQCLEHSIIIANKTTKVRK